MYALCVYKHTQLKCQSGHSYCVNCWSSYLTVQVRDNGAGSLKCPGIKCGEILDMEVLYNSAAEVVMIQV